MVGICVGGCICCLDWYLWRGGEEEVVGEVVGECW